jgi:hypothetical protein
MTLKLEVFANQPNWNEQTSEIRPTLNAVEKKRKYGLTARRHRKVT